MRILINNKATEDNTTVNEVTTAFPVSYMYSNTLIEKTYFEDYIDIDMVNAHPTILLYIQQTYFKQLKCPTLTKYIKKRNKADSNIR